MKYENYDHTYNMLHDAEITIIYLEVNKWIHY